MYDDHVLANARHVGARDDGHVHANVRVAGAGVGLERAGAFVLVMSLRVATMLWQVPRRLVHLMLEFV